jgi:hypothetical protein
MLGDVDRQVEQFDLLNDLEPIGRREAPTADFRVRHFVNVRLVHAVRRPGWPPRFRFLRAPFPTGVVFGGLTMSLDGDLDEFEESFKAFARASLRASISRRSSSMSKRCSSIKRSFASMAAIISIQ